MQIYSLGFGGSLFPSTKNTQQTQMQAKPYALSLANHDTVHFSGENNTARKRKYETLCLSVGVKDYEITRLREAAKETDNVKNANVKQKADRLNSEHAKLLKEEYTKRLKNETGEYDGAHELVDEPEWKRF